MKNYGFIKPVILEEEYVFGAAQLPYEILQADGQWDAFLPVYEGQADLYETWGCTVFGTLNALEIIFKKKYGTEFNFAERFPYILADIRKPGSDPHKVIEIIRKNGLINQEELPITPTYAEFILPSPMSAKFLVLARNWLTGYTICHEWLWKGSPTKAEKIEIIKNTLPFSPIGASFTAWNVDSDGIYRDHGQANNHWGVIFGFTDKGWKVFDTYEHDVKIYSFESNIELAKKYHIGENTVVPELTFMQKLINWIKNI